MLLSALQQGRTPLHEAAGKARLEMVRMLLDRSADMEVKDNVRVIMRGVM